MDYKPVTVRDCLLFFSDPKKDKQRHSSSGVGRCHFLPSLPLCYQSSWGTLSKVRSTKDNTYEQGFDANTMELNMLKGEATVTSLQLKRNLLDKFNLPVTIKEGYLGKVHLKVPWHDLQNQSAVIRISDIFLLASALPDQVCILCQPS